ncbi:hypothetical protein [Allofournierella massiliensis]|uniref:hypothetical protein n=1 Tax=Allofournierella massiliensis TaxID=1650663 RepID=UPI0024B12254|nr:hypothetical protein [Fournierella massiliensis]
MKKRLVASVLASAMLAASIPFPAFAEEPYQCDLVVDLAGADLEDGYFDPGDIVDVTISIANAGWSNPDSGSELLGMQFGLKFDEQLFSWVKNARDQIYTVGSTFENYAPMENSATGEYQLFFSSGEAPALTDEKIVVATCQLQVADPAPAKAGETEIGLQLDADNILFGDFDTETYVDAVANLVSDSALVDTIVPVIQLEGTPASGEAVFYYQPVAVSVTDDSSTTLALDGKPWSGQSLTEGGTLCATDARGNSATVQVIIDAAAFNQAIAAVEQIPETIDYKSISLIQAAQKAIEAVTDSAASAKLAAQKQKVQDALGKWNAIDEQVTAVENLIAALPADVKPSDAAKLDEIQQKIDELKELGVETSDIANYSVYSAAVENLAGALAEIQAVRDQIKELPAAEDVNFADAAAINGAEKAAKDLQAKYGEEVLSAEDLAPLVAAQAKLSELNDARKALVEEIANTQLNITTAQKDQDAIQALRDKVTELEALETTFTADELKNLVDAEKAMAELLKQSEEAHAALAKLPAQDEVLYTDKAAIDAAQKMVKDLEGKDTFTEEEQAKLAAAQAGYQDILDGIAQVESDIAALPDEVTPDMASQIAELQQAIARLTKRAVPVAEIEGYDKYQAAADALESILAEIQAVRDQIKALPAAEDVNFADAAAINGAEKAAKNLQAKYGEKVLSAEDLAPLAAAQAKLSELNDARKALVEEIANTQLNITTAQKDQDAIQALRDKVTELEALETTFTADELKNLVDAEKAMAELLKQSEEAHAALAKLPAQDEVLYTDKAAIDAAQKMVKDLEGKDTFTEEEQAKLAAAQAGYQDILDGIAQVESDIEALPDEVTPDQLNVILQIQHAISALAERKVPTDVIKGYEKYQAAADALEGILAEIQAVRDQVNALPDKENVCFTDEANIENAAKAVKALQEKYGADVLTEKELAPLAAAQEGLTELKAEREQLVQDIANAELPVTLKREDVERIEALRERVKALEARKAEFTQEELLVLTNAEKALEQLKERSSDAHKALDSLPGRDEILYTDNVKLEQLIHEMNELEALGDTFTAEEKAKVEAAQAGLKDLDERLEALAARMKAVDGEVIYSDISLLASIDQEKVALQARGCPIDENTVGKEALDHYAVFVAAISAMKKELADLNQDMEDALDHWSYNNESAFDAIRVKMDAAAQKYQMTGDQKKAVFAQYSESQDRNAEVKKLLDEAKQEINDLPKDITLDQSKDVAAITNLLDKLIKEYGLTNKVLETELGTAYTTYKNAVSKLEDLKEEKPDSQEPSGGQTANGGAEPQSTQAPAAAQGTSPSTGDSFNLLAMAGVFMTAAIGWIVLKIGIRRRED